MTPIEDIRRRYWAEPFAPFEVELVDGRRLYVSQRLRVAIAPDDSSVHIVTPGDHGHWLMPEQIRRVLPELAASVSERTGT